MGYSENTCKNKSIMFEKNIKFLISFTIEKYVHLKRSITYNIVS